jgi:hypothetical protein
MGFGLIDMGKSLPLGPLPSLVDTYPPIFVCVHLQLAIHFIHYIQFTSFTYYITLALNHILHLQYTSLGSRPYTTSTIYIASLGFENGDVTD